MISRKTSIPGAFLVFVAFVSPGSSVLRDGGPRTLGGALLVTEPQVCDFGEVLAGEEAKALIRIWNRGALPTTVQSIRFISCCCNGLTVAPVRSNGALDLPAGAPLGTIEPNAYMDIDLRLSTGGLSGDLHKRLALYGAESKILGMIDAHIKVVPAWELDPEVVDFGHMGYGRGCSKTLVIRPHGIGSILVLGATNIPPYVAVQVERAMGNEERGAQLLVALTPAAPAGLIRVRMEVLIAHERVRRIPVLVKAWIRPKLELYADGKRLPNTFCLGVFSSGASIERHFEIVDNRPDPGGDLVIIDHQPKSSTEPTVEVVLHHTRSRGCYDLQFTIPAGHQKGMIRGDLVIASMGNHRCCLRISYRGWCN